MPQFTPHPSFYPISEHSEPQSRPSSVQSGISRPFSAQSGGQQQQQYLSYQSYQGNYHTPAEQEEEEQAQVESLLGDHAPSFPSSVLYRPQQSEYTSASSQQQQQQQVEYSRAPSHQSEYSRVSHEQGGRATYEQVSRPASSQPSEYLPAAEHAPPRGNSAVSNFSLDLLSEARQKLLLSSGAATAAPVLPLYTQTQEQDPDDSYTLAQFETARSPTEYASGDEEDEDEGKYHFGLPPDEAHERRHKTRKRIPLTAGNLVMDLPISSKLAEWLFKRGEGEMSSVRYTAVTCQPDDFEKNRFQLRQNILGRRTEIAICITLYNEDEHAFCRTLLGVMKNISQLCNRPNSSTWNQRSWQKVVVIIVADGRTKIHPRVLDCLAALGVYQPESEKSIVNNKIVHAQLYEYTTSLGLGTDLNFKGPEKAIVPTQIIFCLKEKNAKKINSHKWFFNAFCRSLQPNVCILLDVGTRPGPQSIYHLWKAFDRNSNVGGACGEIKVDMGKHHLQLLNPLVAAQVFEYKMSNILEKTTESMFGAISVLPGAFSAYRFRALQNDNLGLGPLAEYFKGESMHGHESTADVFTKNMYLAEDRILCFSLMAKRNESWTLAYVRSATATTDVPSDVTEWISQRRRWLNGSFFCSIYAFVHTPQIFNTDHSAFRKGMLLFLSFYQFLSLVFSWFALGNFYIFFVILTTALEDPALGNSKISTLNIITQWIYGGLVVTVFLISMGNRPQGSKTKYLTVIYLFAALSVYMITAAIICTVHAIQNSESDALYTQMVVSIGATYGIWIISSILSLDPWHLVTCMGQYLLFAASYTNLLNVYAFSNLHDVSWGTKGDNVIDSALEVVSSDKPHSQTVVVGVLADQKDIDALYVAALSNLKNRKVEPVAPLSAANKDQIQKDYYANLRTDVLLIWVLSNSILIGLILTGVSGSNENAFSGGEKQRIYMVVILVFVALLSAIRFIGSTSYLVATLFRLI